MDTSLKVLVVDDDSEILEVLVTYLEERGYEVTSRSNGREALTALRDEDIHLVITDGRMAGMDGFEFIRIARANYPELGIILMTAYESDYPLSEALAAGADGYLTKPFSFRKFALVFEKAFWTALDRSDWWEANVEKIRAN